MPVTKSPAPKSPVTAPTETSAASPGALGLEEVLKTRRSSSLSSDGSIKRRFLKLGPVHFGEGDGTGDWSEAVVAE